ncbi:FYVE and coiled-coil domain-containing protein 1-like isoform X6 [Chelonia mydas]|uniref:FYVE and coiled-coil domain-containing protein 1-like isoform X6 n=1 Tax=Chelonia mydas TaxID=8469 RepID=UPI001CA8E871|nr:FYVE and coiled-coil domain-containing protein 1-like isoform X6 [Chelonia mydas]
MSHQKQSSFPGLPSRYSGDGCFQHGTDRGVSGWGCQDPENSKRSPRASRPCSVLELERSYTNSYPSSGVPFQGENPLNGTPGPREPGHANSAWRESSRGSLSPKHIERARSMSPLRGIHSIDSGIVLTSDMECARRHSSPPLRRRHSLSRLPDWGTEEYGPMRPLARRVWSGLELDLRGSLPENVQRTAALGPSLRDTPGVLEGQAEALQKLELNRVKFELLSIKQKQMESSLTQLEKEKSWLDLSRYEDQKQRGDLQEKILNLEMEVVKAKSCLSRMSCRSVSPSPSQRLSVEKEELNREMTALQETLSGYKEHMKVLEAERDEMTQQLNSAKEGQQLAFSQTNEANQRVTDSLQATKALHKEIGRLQGAYNSTSREKELLSSKVARLEERVSELTMKLKPALSDRERFLKEKVELHQQVQDLTLQLEHAQRSQEGFNGQVSDLHLELVNAKAQANRQDQEKVLMKEELVTLRQVNEKLSSELGQSHQRLETSLGQLHHLEAEKKILTNRIQALETERMQLLGEQEALKSEMQRDAGGQGNDVAALQTTCEGLRASQSLLQAEKKALQARCMELEAVLRHKQEELCGQLAEQQQVSQHWKDRWNQVAVALKTKEEELEQAHVAHQSLSAKHTELLEDCELLQVDAEELAELRGTVRSLKEENGDLMRQLREQQQATQLLQLQQELATNTSLPGSGSERTSEQEALYKEIQETHDRIKRLENEKAEMKSEIRKLKLDGASVLRIELDACKQELELEKSRSQALNGKVQLLQSRRWDSATPPHEIKFPATSNTTATSGLEMDCPVSSPGSSQISSPQGEPLAMESPQGLMASGDLSEVESLKRKLQRETASQQEKEELIWTLREELEELKLKQPGDIKASLEEVDTELALVREELQKVWDMLKTRDTALEEQHLELESARSQYTECSSEKLRLEQLVASLEHQLAEREQALRHLRQASEMEKNKLEIQASSLELKLAEVEVLRDDAHRRHQASGPTEVQSWGLRQSRDSHSQGKCSRCDAFLAQLNKMIQSCTEKGAVVQEDQALTYLCDLQGLLKRLSHCAADQVTRSPQEKSQTLEQQHRLVTEQNTRGAIKPHGKPPQELKEKQQPMPGDLGFSNSTDEAQSLRLQLQEKTEMISAMASEIQGLQQKNEHLMKAKLRFQQQIQDIRSLQQQRQERSDSDLLVPRLSSRQELELGLSQWSEGSAPPSGGDPHASSLCPLYSRAALYLAKLPEAGDELRCFSSESSGSQSPRSQAGSELPVLPLSKLPADPVTGKLPPPSTLPLPASNSASGKSSPEARSSPVSPRSQPGSQESSYTPKGAVLLSPRPFRAQRLGSPFKFRMCPEPPGESCGS